MKFLLLGALLVSCAVHAQMNKCVVNGKVEYRDSACEDANSSKAMYGGTANTIGAIPQAEINRAKAMTAREQAQQPSVTVIGGGRNGVTEQDVKNLETAASSKTLAPKERAFLQQEVRRARAALEGEGTYTKQDMDRVKEAQAAQNRIDAREREQARGDAEDIHLRKGSPARQAEILQTRQAEEDRKNARRAAAAAAPRYITNCDAAGCWGTDGTRYNRAAGGSFVRQDGKICRTVGTMLQCD